MIKDQLSVFSVKNPEDKAAIVKGVLADLPEWFGLPESTAQYIEEAKEAELCSAEQGGERVGFITLTQTTEVTAEIHCMGVKKVYHRKGVGKELFNALESYAAKHFSYLQVKTVDQGHYIEYDQTIAFYQSSGFSKLEVFPMLWDKWNPCLIMVKRLQG